MSFETELTQLEEGRVLRFRLRCNGEAMSWHSVIAHWQGDRRFRDFFISLLANAPFPAFFWETPRLTQEDLDIEFEYVLVESDRLIGVGPDRNAFASHFDNATPGTTVTRFTNLGGDAMLVAPCPRGPITAYSQIANFAREAPVEQQHELWNLVGKTLEERVARTPVWLNTSGLGIYWLHVRLDSMPKYYTYLPYRNMR